LRKISPGLQLNWVFAGIQSGIAAEYSGNHWPGGAEPVSIENTVALPFENQARWRSAWINSAATRRPMASESGGVLLYNAHRARGPASVASRSPKADHLLSSAPPCRSSSSATQHGMTPDSRQSFAPDCRRLVDALGDSRHRADIDHHEQPLD
jgi:hypothetical protein